MPKAKHGLLCPKCGTRSQEVVRTLPGDFAIIRQRVCKGCGHRRITRETDGWGEIATGSDSLRKAMELPTSTNQRTFILAGEEQNSPSEIKTDGDQSDHVES